MKLQVTTKTKLIAPGNIDLPTYKDSLVQLFADVNVYLDKTSFKQAEVNSVTCIQDPEETFGYHIINITLPPSPNDTKLIKEAFDHVYNSWDNNPLEPVHFSAVNINDITNITVLIPYSA